MELTSQQLCEIMEETSTEFEIMEDRRDVGYFRHGTENEYVLRHIESGKFFTATHRSSCKDMIDRSDINSGDQEMKEVFAKQVTTTIYS